MENELNTEQQRLEDFQFQDQTQAQAERIEQLRLEQNLPMGILFGVGAALVSAFLWALITVLTGYQIGYMAIAVGFLVGYAVRIGGKGIDPVFGIMGAVLALVGCVLGNFFGQVGFFAQYFDLGYFEAFSSMDFGMIKEVMVDSFSLIDLLFYGIAVYEGYHFSFRKIQ